jgi:hypothetical protein
LSARNQLTNFKAIDSEGKHYNKPTAIISGVGVSHTWPVI